MSDPAFRRVESRVIFRDPVLGLREDVIAGPADSLITRKVVEYRPSVAVVAFTPGRKIILIRHFRYPVGETLWELPGGICESSESVLDSSSRELLEETGYAAERYEEMLTFFPEPAFTDHMITIVRADLARPSERPQKDVDIGELGFFDVQDTPHLIREGLIRSSWTIIGMMLASTQPVSANSGD